MKKFLTVVCMLTMITSFASCGESNEESSIATEVSTEAETKAEKETEPATETTTQEESAEPETETTTEEETTAPEIIVLYEENGLKISYKGLTSDEYFGDLDINLFIENNCGQDITVQCRDFYINDFETEEAFSCDLANGKKANDKISVWKSDLENNNLTIDNIEKIEFSFHVTNEESWDTIVDSPVITINTLQNGTKTDEMTSENTAELETTTEQLSEQPTEESVAIENTITATAIMQYFIDNGAPNIGEYIERTESDDKLLGRPEQYISKVSFRITTVELDEKDPYDASIEVFNNADDALKRYNEVNSLLEEYPMFKEYLYLKENVLLRIKFDVLPEDEQVYEQLLNDYIGI